jgi:hypothetical protein
MPFLAGIKGFANPCLLACPASGVLRLITYLITFFIAFIISFMHIPTYIFSLVVNLTRLCRQIAELLIWLNMINFWILKFI